MTRNPESTPEQAPVLGVRGHWARYAAGMAIEAGFALLLIALGGAVAWLAVAMSR